MKQAVEIFQSNNLPINHLNLGGGFGIAYDNTQKQLDIRKLAILIDDIYPNPSFKISIERLIQIPDKKNKKATIVIITHKTIEKNSRKCLKIFKKNNNIVKTPTLIRLL